MWALGQNRWRHILSRYDRLAEFDDSPIVALNRAIVVANLDGPEAGLDAVAGIRDLEKLNSYYLLYAVLGEFEAQLNHPQAAAGHFRESLKLAAIKSEQMFLSKRLRACQDSMRSNSGRPTAISPADTTSSRLR